MADRPFHSTFAVPVTGGNLTVGMAGAPLGAAPVVLAVHGITGSHRSFLAIARHLAEEATVLAPDLRGRGGSAGLPGPHGMAAHVADLVAVLAAAGVGHAVLAGHSMGAYVVARLAAAHPALADAVVMIDGGLPLGTPGDLDPDDILDAILGPALARLRREFASPDEYRGFWKAHPAFARPDVWTADIEDYADYDLVGEPPAMRSRVEEVAVRVDGRDLLDPAPGWAALAALAAVACPVVLLRAPRGLLDEPPPLISDEVVVEASALLPGLVDVVVADTNHYLIAMGRREAATVAAQIRSVSP